MSKNFKKSIVFFLKKSEICERKKFQQKKSSSYLNIWNMHVNQSSPVKPNPEKKIWKNLLKYQIFQKVYEFGEKKIFTKKMILS